MSRTSEPPDTFILACRRWWIKMRHWEYWPFAVVYAPIMPIWWWYCLRARSFFFFNAANPAIENGGFLMEEKSSIYPLLPQGSYPTTLLFTVGTNPQQVLDKVQHWPWPLIAKPNIGMQGKRVKKLNNAEDLLQYATASPVDFLVQHFVPFANEVGIFYHRMPGEKEGKITGMVRKHFAAVMGNGTHTVAQLLMQNDRYLLQYNQWQQDPSIDLRYIPAKGEKYLLAPYGNHARGALFLDATDAVTPQLTRVIDVYCRQIEGFYYGRLDIHYASWHDLCAGRQFVVIELNGAGSEPTHMYDPQHSLWYAWKEIIRHWRLLFETATAVHRQQQVPYMTAAQGWQMLQRHRAHVQKLG